MTKSHCNLVRVHTKKMKIGIDFRKKDRKKIFCVVDFDI